MSSVQKLQNFAVRVAMGGVKKYDQVSPFRKELQWLHVKQKHVFEVATTIFKILRVFYPEWFLSFRSRQAITSSVARQRHCLHVARTNTHSGYRCTVILGARVWNALLPSLTEETSINSFKALLKEILLTDNIFS